MKRLKHAKSAARTAIESTYDGLCTVIEYKPIKDEKTKITRNKEVTVFENEPCRLSFVKQNTVVQTETATAISLGAKLFIAPEIEIRSGSKIIVCQNGRTGEYALSGEPAVYSTHQEIMIELFRGWA
ncbi:MAG: hypothetical protein NC110_07575 [Ruminococcus sp.]|nr:hypothetical protein [Ruminococcus sp.]